MDDLNEILRSTFAYDRETGVVSWLRSVGQRGRPGKEAGSIWTNAKGKSYRIIQFGGKPYAAHRLAWFLETGEWPICLLDHEDCDGLNNRWRNIRRATRVQNANNACLRRDSTSGFKGVTFRTATGRYLARIQVNARRLTLGSYTSPEEAHAAYCDAGTKLHGEFFQSGRSVMNAPIAAGLGHNQPPALSAYEAHKVNISDLYEESRHWIDGVAVANAEQAEKVQTLLRMLEEAEAAAEESRVAEKRPLDLQIADIQDRYNILIAPIKNKKPGLTQLAIQGCKAALTVWLKKVQDDKDAEAKRLREIADAEAAKALALAEAARATPDLTAMEQAQDAVAVAQQAVRTANRAETTRATATGYGRAATLRTIYTPVLSDPVKALGWAWTHERQAVEEALLVIAKTRTSGGVCTMAGVTLTEERRV